MNPIEQIWKEIQKLGFKNEIFSTLEKVVDRLCDVFCSFFMSNYTVRYGVDRSGLFYSYELGDVSANLTDKKEILTNLEFKMLRVLLEQG